MKVVRASVEFTCVSYFVVPDDADEADDEDKGYEKLMTDLTDIYGPGDVLEGGLVDVSRIARLSDVPERERWMLKAPADGTEHGVPFSDFVEG